MVILSRDQDLDGVLLSMGRLEARFNNSRYRCHPWVAALARCIKQVQFQGRYSGLVSNTGFSLS